MEVGQSPFILVARDTQLQVQFSNKFLSLTNSWCKPQNKNPKLYQTRTEQKSPLKRSISVKTFQNTARSSSTFLHRAHSPIITWQLMKVIVQNINRFEVYFCQWYLIIISKANIKKRKQPPEHTYSSQWNPFCAALYKAKKGKEK